MTKQQTSNDEILTQLKKDKYYCASELGSIGISFSMVIALEKSDTPRVKYNGKTYYCMEGWI